MSAMTYLWVTFFLRNHGLINFNLTLVNDCRFPSDIGQHILKGDGDMREASALRDEVHIHMLKLLSPLIVG